MTLIDVFNTFPVWIKTLLGILFFFWAVELFLLPFKFNLVYSYYKKKDKEIDVLLTEIKSVYAVTLANNKVLSLFVQNIKRSKVENNKKENESE